MKITLIGFMGSGKTTIAEQLSQRLNIAQADLDTMIEAKAGCSIPQYFNSFGEAKFRALEQLTLKEALTADGILSTGGGTPVQPDNQTLFNQHDGAIILLDAADETIQQRLLADGVESRPLFQQLGMAGILALKHQRQASYEQVATHVINVDGKAPQKIAEQIINELQSLN